MDRRILIVSNRGDLHADIVTEKIKTLGGSIFRLNVEEFPRDYHLTFDSGNGTCRGDIVHAPTGEQLSLSVIGAVWLRRFGEFAFLSGDLSAQEQAFARAESEQVLFGLLCSLDCYWMSHPSATRQAKWKGEQLLRAARMGFKVPPSIISNCRNAVDAFRDAMCRDIIYKTLSSPYLESDRVRPEERIAQGVPTTRITENDEPALDAVRELPCLFQQYIPKLYEVRATVIGKRVFAARIHSQDDPRTATDFRDFSADIKYEVEVLPIEIESRCLAFVHSYQLNYGAIDLIVTPDGEFVFLENNPAGQFLFVEQLVPELNMTDALAARLVEEANA
jgi:glutathione synthase/RimK-type ligase-like ATP-grasp enzyme